jgi:hypothetical protein
MCVRLYSKLKSIQLALMEELKIKKDVSEKTHPESNL